MNLGAQRGLLPRAKETFVTLLLLSALVLGENLDRK